MRFSLRSLLLMFPAILLAYGMAWAIVKGFIDQPTISSHAGWDRFEYNHLCIYTIRSAREKNAAPIDWRKLNHYFAGSLSKFDPDYARYAKDYPNPTDELGNPYGCIPLNETFEPDENQVSPPWLGFYSVGADGLSRTQGNDADDMNSWRYEQPAARLAWEDRKAWHYRKRALWLTPVTLLVVSWAWQKWTRRPHLEQGVATDAV